MITIVGAVSGNEPVFDAAQIEAALLCPQIMEHNATFTGRPATQLFVDEQVVVKLRTDFVFQFKDRLKRAEAALDAERRLGAHHPDKCWFVQEDGDSAVIGNIAPRLQPAHQFFKSRAVEDNHQVLQGLVQILELYCRTVMQADRRLDEGLSNFGLDASGRYFYLDDDSYDWDDFTSLASVLGVWIRQLDALSDADWSVLGSHLADTLAETFGTVHPVRMLHGQLRNNLAVSAREQVCTAALMEALSVKAKARVQVVAGKEPHQFEQPKQTSGESVTVSLLSRPLLEHISAPRFGLLADIHANVVALDAVLAELDRQGVEQILVLGDVVGYGPHPQACIERLAQRRCLVVQGNHDFATASGDTSRGFSKLAKWAVDWTRDQLPSSCLNWLGQLPPVHRQDNWIAVHGAPVDKSYFFAYVYHMTYQANLDWLQEQGLQIGFHGHSHLQLVYRRSGRGDDKDEGEHLDLSRDRCSLVCPGAVGQPRGGGTAAEFAIYDSLTGNLTQHHVPYALDGIVEDMKRLHFPAQLHERLLVGA